MPAPARDSAACPAAYYVPLAAPPAAARDVSASKIAVAPAAGGVAGPSVTARLGGFARSYFPILEWAADYRTEYLFQDVAGGVTLGLMCFLQTLVGATIATVFPICGPYSAFVPPIIYAMLGPSKHASVSEGAVGSILVASMMADEPDIASRTSIAMFTALIAGVIQILMSVCRFGFVVRFLSHACIHGYTSGCAFVVITAQIKTAVGLERTAGCPSQQLGWIEDVSGGRDVVTKTLDTVCLWREFHTPTLSLFIFLFVCIVVSKPISGLVRKKAATTSCTASLSLVSKVFEFKEIVVMVMGSAVVFCTMKDGEPPVRIVGDIPTGLPGFHAPLDEAVMEVLNGPPEKLCGLIANAAMIAVASFLLSWGAVKQAALAKGYTVDATKELRALGTASLVGSCFGAISVQTALTRTALAVQMGTHTQVASLVSASVIGFVLFSLSPLLYYIPKVALTAIVMMAIQGYMNFELPRKFAKSPRKAFRDGLRKDFIVWCVGFGFTLCFGATIGFGVSVAASLLQALAEVMAARAVKLDSTPLLCADADATRHRKTEEYNDGILVIELRGRMCFYEAEVLRDDLVSRLRGDTQVVILSLVGASHVDYTALVTLKDMLVHFKQRGVDCILAEGEPVLSEWLGKDLNDLVTSTCASAQEGLLFARFADGEEERDRPLLA